MKIIDKKILTDQDGIRIVQMDISSGDIARRVSAGQFVMLMVSEKGERIPLTVVDADKQRGSIRLVFQESGLTTRMLGRMNPGDTLYSLVGPLGHATPINSYGRVILAGGGVGTAEILPVARALKEAGNRITTVLGFRNKGLLILEDELRACSEELHVMTDDGSYGRKGFVTDMLDEILSGERFDLVYSVGPIPMMKMVATVTARYNVRTMVSLSALMVDGTGMCGCCRVTVSGRVKFSCVDGPDFDAHSVDWEELEKRSKVYSAQEKHVCRLLAEGRI
jgi:ferredoxin--NADP+ reductase